MCNAYAYAYALFESYLNTPSGNTQISFHGLYKLVQAPKVSKVTSRQARSIFCQVDKILY